MTHIEQRLAERQLSIQHEKLVLIAKSCGSTASAVVLGNVPYQGQADGAYRSRSESNGDMVILIVRDAKPITVMFRRSDQPLTAEALKVVKVYTL